MYVLINLDRFYPSIIHFNTKEECLEFAEKNELNDEYEAYHIVKIEHSHLGSNQERELYEDIEWGLYK